MNSIQASGALPRLCKATLEERGGRRYEAPVTAVQFGEGNFLRAFVDPFIHELNERGLFNGSIAVVQPIPKGLAQTLNDQDCLYTLFPRSLGDPGSEPSSSLIQSIRCAINPYAEWDRFLAFGRSEELRFVFSNTTEAGIAFRSCAYPKDCPEGFPAKIARLLHERYLAFEGGRDRGLVFLPCELIEANGDALKTCVLQHVREWDLEKEFVEWIEAACVFCNTLVDRIVPGYPAESSSELEDGLGYRDSLLVEAEAFGLWVIQSPRPIHRELPLDRCRSGKILFVPDIRPYRNLKVRILNGAHTVISPLGFLCGVSTVREAVEDPLLGLFLERALQREILPVLSFSQQEKESYADDVLKRFRNPYIRHQLMSINLNSVSKFRTRVLPTLQENFTVGRSPRALAFSLAALIAFYRGQWEGEKCMGSRKGIPYQIQDDAHVLKSLAGLYERYVNNPKAMVSEVLSNESLWGSRLDKWEGLEGLLREFLPALLKSPRRALEDFLKSEGEDLR